MMKALSACFVLFASSLSPLAAEDGKIPTPEETVRKLYDGHLKDDTAFSKEESRAKWDFMFGEELRKALKSEGWGFDPLFFGQDHDIKKVDVRQIDKDDKGNSLVLVSFVNFGEPVRLVVALRHTDHGHQILNIVQPSTGVGLIRDLVYTDE